MEIIIKILAVSGFLIGGFALILSTIVIRKKRTKLYWFFVLWCLAIAIWSLPYGVWLLSNTHNTALFWIRNLSIGSTLIPIFHLHSVLIFLNLDKKRKPLLIIAYILAIIFLSFNYSACFIRDVEYTFGFPYWPKPGFLYHIYLFLYFIPCFIYSFVEIFKKYRRSVGQKRAQLRYVFWGIILGVISGCTNFPLWYNINIPPYLNPLVIVYMTAYAYAIFSYRFLDIRFAFRRSFLYFILAAFAYGTFYGITLLFTKIFGSVWAKPALILGIFIAIIFAVLWPQVEKLTIKFSNKFLYVSVYNMQDTISNLARNLTTIVDLKKIVSLITDAMLKTMDIEKVAVYTKEISTNNFQACKIINFSKDRLANINRKKKLFTWLSQNKLALVRGEIALQAQDTSKKTEKKELLQIEHSMAQLEAELCLPLIIKDKLIGLILLGEKRSADAYTIEDIKLLEILANQSAIAIENALLYNNMEEIIAEQTADLKEKNANLEKLLKMRSEFLDIASHQLRTPVSIIKGNLSMMLEGDFDKDPIAKQKAIQAMFLKTEKLNNIINDILIASELDTNKFDLTNLARAEDISRLTEKAINDIRDKIAEKQIKLNFNKTAEKFMVKSYDRYLSMIIDNLLDNAITYTLNKGTITITLEKEKDNKDKEIIKFKISDTGIGIPEKDKEKLFDKFKRAKNANSMKTDGTGIGLFIVKELVKAHTEGDIGFKSQEGRGSTFWFSLPVYEENF